MTRTRSIRIERAARIADSGSDLISRSGVLGEFRSNESELSSSLSFFTIVVNSAYLNTFTYATDALRAERCGNGELRFVPERHAVWKILRVAPTMSKMFVV